MANTKVFLLAVVLLVGLIVLASSNPLPNPEYYGYYDYYGKYGNYYYGKKHGKDGYKGNKKHHHQEYGYY